MSDCSSQDCASCGGGCGGGPVTPADLIEKAHPDSRIGRVIAVMSGKGGVGKSTVTSLLAVAMQRAGKKAAILDADITGPSIPRMFGVTDRPGGSDDGILPVKTKSGIPVISLNLLTENESDPVIWRGPVVAGVVTQFWKDVVWGDVDYMFVDMPPGTGDVPLTVLQSLPVDGIVVVTSPQDLVSMIVGKAINMAKMMNVPVSGLIENYAYFKCPNCDQEHQIFGESHVQQAADQHGLKVLARLPMEAALARAADAGTIEDAASLELLADAVDLLKALPKREI